MSPLPLGIVASAGAVPAGAYDLIQTVSVSSATSDVEFYNLNTYTDYKHLQFRLTFKNNGSSGVQPYMRFNSGTTNYAWHYLNGTGGGSPGTGGYSSTNYIGFMETTGYSASQFSTAVIDLLDHANESKNRTVRIFSGGFDTLGYRQIGLMSGFRNATGSLTNVSFTMPNNFSVGSRVSLYGIKG